MKTNVRGVKIRGVFQTEEEARRRAKTLQTRDSSFNVFVGPVGYWLPWDPCADHVQDEEFMNEQLNEMIKKYKENELNKDMLYEQEKREKMKGFVEIKMFQKNRKTIKNRKKPKKLFQIVYKKKIHG